jgi:hypothetical protein
MPSSKDQITFKLEFALALYMCATFGSAEARRIRKVARLLQLCDCFIGGT